MDDDEFQGEARTVPEKKGELYWDSSRTISVCFMGIDTMSSIDRKEVMYE
jgi:hypothetical protein